MGRSAFFHFPLSVLDVLCSVLTGVDGQAIYSSFLWCLFSSSLNCKWHAGKAEQVIPRHWQSVKHGF